MEKTLCILKPDVIERHLQEKIYERIEKGGLKIKAARKMRLTQEQAAAFYCEHQERPFFKDLCTNMTCGDIEVLLLEGDNAVTVWRTMMGATNPEQAEPGTIRKDFGLNIDRNAVHGSDSLTSSAKEIAFFFAGCDLFEHAK